MILEFSSVVYIIFHKIAVIWVKPEKPGFSKKNEMEVLHGI